MKKTNTEALNKLWYTAPVTFLLSALLPEYVAPVLMIVCFAIVLKNRLKNKMKPRFGAVGTAIIIYICWMIIGAFYSSFPVSALASIGLWILMMLGFYITTEVIDSETKIQKMIYFGCITAGTAGLIGILQMVLFHYGDLIHVGLSRLFNPFWHFLDVLISKVVVFLPDFIVSAMPRTKFLTFPTRACSTLSNPLFFSAFEVIMMPFAAHCFVCSEEKKKRIIGFVCLFLSVGGIACSYSRGPYMYAAIVFLLLLLYGGKKTLKLGAIGSVSLLGIVIFASGTIKRFLTLGDNTDASLNNRTAIWKAIIEKSKTCPVFGLGTGFNSARSVIRNEGIAMQSHAHNIFLEILIENGIIGVILFLLLLVVFMINIIRLAKKGNRCRLYAVTFFASVSGFILCGMTDCLFYGLKPLQYLMLVLGLSQALFFTYLGKEGQHVLPEKVRRKFAKKIKVK